MVAADLSLSRLVEKAPTQGLEVQLLVALALQAAGDSSHPLLHSTLSLVLSSIRVTARTAYVSSVPGGSSAASECVLGGGDEGRTGLLVQSLNPGHDRTIFTTSDIPRLLALP